MRVSKITLSIMLITGSILVWGCGITPANIDQRTPRQDFQISGNLANDLVPYVVGLLESRYPFKYFQTTVVESHKRLTIRSYDESRGYVLWIVLIQESKMTRVRIYLSPDLYWNTERIAGELREAIENFVG